MSFYKLRYSDAYMGLADKRFYLTLSVCVGFEYCKVWNCVQTANAVIPVYHNN